jgi:hypothetical protein
MNSADRETRKQAAECGERTYREEEGAEGGRAVFTVVEKASWCCNAGNLRTWFWTFSMVFTYEILGIRSLLIDKLNNDPISRSRSFIRIATTLLRASYAPYCSHHSVAT